MSKVKVIGAGLAGSEAAWQLVNRGIPVRLIEMKPLKFSPAHKMEGFAELVCSNSLKARRIESAAGLLKEEMRRMGSLILACADATRVEAGGCLAVDRVGFSAMVTEKIKNHPNITVIYGEVTEIPEGPVIVASGPLTSDALSDAIGKYFGANYLHFFDAAAPLVTAESIDMNEAWWQSRYDRGTPDYINCAMDRQQYEAFLQELVTAEEAEVHGFEDKNVFEGCMPVEIMARRGEDTLRFGPMKPVGLTNPKTGRRPYAVLQLRKENEETVCTIKTPLSDGSRGEWECPAAEIESGIASLLSLGAPESLTELTGPGVIPVCGAKFTRIAKTVVTPECTVELALDQGILMGGGKALPLCEVEVELKIGSTLLCDRFARELADRYGLQPEEKSKFARALALSQGDKT